MTEEESAHSDRLIHSAQEAQPCGHYRLHLGRFDAKSAARVQVPSHSLAVSKPNIFRQ